MRASIRFLFVAFCVLAFASQAQLRVPAGREFQITKITKNLIPTPDYGIGQYRPVANERWLEVEVEFNAAPEWTDDLTLKYYILFNGRLLTGEVTHANISAGLNRSVIYVLPLALARFAGNRPLLPNIIQNVAVQIVQGGYRQLDRFNRSSVKRLLVGVFRHDLFSSA